MQKAECPELPAAARQLVRQRCPRAGKKVAAGSPLVCAALELAPGGTREGGGSGGRSLDRDATSGFGEGGGGGDASDRGAAMLTSGGVGEGAVIPNSDTPASMLKRPLLCRPLAIYQGARQNTAL